MENQKIDEFICKELKLQDKDYSGNIAKLTTTYNEITACANELERMRKDYCCELLKDWTVRLAQDFRNHKIHKDLHIGKKMCTGIVLPYKDIEEAIYVNLEFIDKKLCYGATYLPDSHKMRDEMQASDLIKPFWENKEFVKGVDWLFYKYIDIEEGYDCLKRLINRMV